MGYSIDYIRLHMNTGDVMSAQGMAPVNARVRADERETFYRICDMIGTTPSNAIRMFVSAFNRRGGFPFDTANPYGFNAETLQAMDDAVNGRNLSGPYNSVEEMFAAMDLDGEGD